MEVKNSKVIFRKGRKVILRPISKETDLKLFVQWLNNPEIARYLLVYMPITTEGEEKWHDNLDDRNDIVLAIETLGGKIIGNIGLHNIDWKNSNAEIGAFIGDKRYWNKDYGTDAMMTMLDFAFNTLNLRKVCAQVYDFNNRSLGMTRKCGFDREGVRKNQFFIEGSYHNAIQIAVFRKDWLPIWERYKKTGKVK